MKNFQTALFLFFTILSFGQNDSIRTSEILWAKAESELYIKLIDSLNSYYLDLKNDAHFHELIKKEEAKSLIYCNQLISEFPNSELVFDALYKKGFITYGENPDLAHEAFLKVVNFNTPKTVYKRKACRMLAQIEIDKKNYEQALLYLDESSKYKKTFYCGTDFNVDRNQLQNMYIICFNGLREK